MEKIHVILLNYNQTDDTITCVNSVLNSTYPIDRIFLIDNSEKLDSQLLSFPKKHKNITFFRPVENTGFAKGVNIGINLSLRLNPDYILLLNNDTVVKNTFLEKLYSGMIEKNADIVTGKIYYFSHPERIWGAGGRINWKKGMGEFYGINKIDIGQFDEPKDISFISGCLMLIKREVLEEVGLFDERFFLYNEDTDFSYRCYCAGFKLVYIPEAVIWHKIGMKKIEDESFSFYFMIRNSFFLIHKCKDMLKKILFYSYSPFYFVHKLFVSCVKNPRNIIAFFYAICDGVMFRYNISYDFLQKVYKKNDTKK